MADYINSNILCQGYIHIELADMTDQRAREILANLDEFVQRRGAFFLYPEIKVDISFKHGSLKAYLTIVGAIYVFLHQYHDFREGVKLFYNDSKRLAESIVSESLFVTRARHPQTKRVEARTGVLGSLQTIVSELDFIETHIGVVPVDEINKHIRDARFESERLLNVLKDERDVNLTVQHLEQFIQHLPKNPPPPKNQKTPPEAILRYHSEIDEFRKALKKQKPKA